MSACFLIAYFLLTLCLPKGVFELSRANPQLDLPYRPRIPKQARPGENRRNVFARRRT